MSRALTLDDIADLRAYERERAGFHEHVVALKRLRRVGVGPIVTLVFENRDTVRFQVQEMARAERMLSDEAIATELAVYNPLIPEPGQLSATLFIELTSKDELQEWLPKLVGIERAIVVRIGEDVVRCIPEAAHAAQLTREEITAAVHYVRFDLTPAQVDAFASSDHVEVTVGVDHPNYRHETVLTDDRRAELLRDLRP